mmetsp:Transcript_68982/g.143838  ORF Transcript_68982/g.143838 Transcript_68982/m.143838 type:complete len:167 (-) Transcript_68982:126-626(-)
MPLSLITVVKVFVKEEYRSFSSSAAVCIFVFAVSTGKTIKEETTPATDPHKKAAVPGLSCIDTTFSLCLWRPPFESIFRNAGTNDGLKGLDATKDGFEPDDLNANFLCNKEEGAKASGFLLYRKLSLQRLGNAIIAKSKFDNRKKFLWDAMVQSRKGIVGVCLKPT